MRLVLVQTRIDADVALWVRRRAVECGGLSVANMLRKIILDAKADCKTTLDATSVELRLEERIRSLEGRVAELELNG